MTTERLAAIEALPEGTYRNTRGEAIHGTVVGPTELEWLIAEVRRLTGALQTTIRGLPGAVDAAYQGGRAAERTAIVKWLSSDLSDCRNIDYDAIERGEHVVEATDAK
jgi:hypothetical protein